MSDIKKRIILITYLGLIPFYFPLFIKLLGLEFSHDKIINFEKLHLIYGSMIVAFLSGMQWQKIINYKIKNQLILPIIPLILIAFFGNNDFLNHSFLIIIFSLFLSLLIDLLFLKKVNDLWFIKLRINVTILAILSYLI